jgi:hypothetical protein
MSTVHTPAVTAKGAAKCSNPQVRASSGDSASFFASPHPNRPGRSHPTAPLPLGSLFVGLRLAFPLPLLRRSPRHARCRSDAGEPRRKSGHQGAATHSKGRAASSSGRRIRSRAEPTPLRSVPADVTPGFKDKSECIEHMCTRIKFHTCVDSVYTKTQCKSVKGVLKLYYMTECLKIVT